MVVDVITGQAGALEELSRLLRTASTVLDRRISENLDGLSVPQWHALAALSTGELLSMSALQAATQLSGASLTRLIDGMVDANLALRKVGDVDRRQVLVAATRRGLDAYRRHLERLAGLSAEVFDSAAARLSDDLRDALAQFDSTPRASS